MLRLAGAYDDLLDVLAAERARPSTDAVLRLWLDLGLAVVSSRVGRPQPQPVPLDRLGEVLDRLAAEPRRPIVRATLFWLWWDAYDADRHVLERILDLIEAQADPGALPSDAVGIGLRQARFALSDGDGEGALRLLQDLLAREDQLHAVNRPVVESLEVWVLFVLGRLRECVAAGERVLARLGSPEVAGVNWAGTADNLAVAYAMSGDLDRAEELMRAILGLGDFYGHITTGCDLAVLLAARGRADEAEALLAEVVDLRLPAPGEAGFRFGISSQVVAARAARAAGHGDLGSARDLLRPVLLDPHLTPDSEYLWQVVLDAARVFDDPPTLEPEAERVAWVAAVRDAAARVHRHGALGPAWSADVDAHLDRALGHDTAEQWAAVVEGWAALGAPVEGALASLRLAERLAQDGDRERATATASAALAEAERVGAVALAEQVRATSRRHRLRVADTRADTPDDGDGHRLTSREREVLALLADGRTNDQIATGLFMSPKTASVHVSRIITKLGVTNRTEAAAYAHRHGLVHATDDGTEPR